MVGVPGKYKGCETCRLRRIKCDNARPLCRKCLDSDRECAGYSRPAVFIIGTPEHQGRCSSHPRRTSKSKTNSGSATPHKGSHGSQGSSASGSRSPPVVASPDIQTSPPVPHALSLPTNDFLSGELVAPPALSAVVPMDPLRTAWDDTITLLSGGMAFHATFAVLQMPIRSLARRVNSDSGSGGSFLFSPLPPYAPPPNFHPMLQDADLQLSSQCLVHLSTPAMGSGMPSAGGNTFLVLYDHASEPWEYLMAGQSIRQQGPSQFTAFPAHHFFARVYRPTAIFYALLSRQSTFLAEPEWTGVPWTAYPKSLLDELLDIVALVPSLLNQTDLLVQFDPTTQQAMAQELLASCQGVDEALKQWSCRLGMAEEEAGRGRGYWMAPSEAGEALAFGDAVTALALVTYWSTLMLLYPCIEGLYAVMLQPVYADYAGLLPYMSTADPAQYGAGTVRELANRVCGGLDFVLASTVQPDLLASPLCIVEAFYQGIHATSGNGAQEMLWCSEFRSRLVARGQDMVNVVQNQSWLDVAQYQGTESEAMACVW